MCSQLRIIAGKYRSRKITFPVIDGLRPTQDRIRETVFNWLQPFIIDSVCLDLFAGSGALGFEAASRGAQYVTFVDSHPDVIAALKENAAKLKIESADFLQDDFQTNRLVQLKKQYDIVFFDPPFQKNLINNALSFLMRNDLLKSNVLVYIECKKNSFQLPKGWAIKRHRHTKTLEYLLVHLAIK